MSSSKKNKSRQVPSGSNPASNPTQRPTASSPRSRNALKHGLFATELFFTGNDSIAFENFRSELRKDLEPSSPLLELLFEPVVTSAWRAKLGLRCEQAEVQKQLAVEKDDRNPPVDDGSPIAAAYSSTASDVRGRLRFLKNLRDGIEERRLVPAELEGAVTQVFGRDFWITLTDWNPTNPTLMCLVEAILKKAETFDMKLPFPAPSADDERKRAELDLSARVQMVLKLVDLQAQQELRASRHVGGTENRGTVLEKGAERLDLFVRYETAALRQFYGALREYEERKKRVKR